MPPRAAALNTREIGLGMAPTGRELWLLNRGSAATRPHLGLGRSDAVRIEVNDAGARSPEGPVAGQPDRNRHGGQVVTEARRLSVAANRPGAGGAWPKRNEVARLLRRVASKVWREKPWLPPGHDRVRIVKSVAYPPFEAELAYAACALFTARMEPMIAVSFAVILARSNAGIAIAPIRPMIPLTTSSSMRVNPRCRSFPARLVVIAALDFKKMGMPHGIPSNTRTRSYWRGAPEPSATAAPVFRKKIVPAVPDPNERVPVCPTVAGIPVTQ